MQELPFHALEVQNTAAGSAFSSLYAHTIALMRRTGRYASTFTRPPADIDRVAAWARSTTFSAGGHIVAEPGNRRAAIRCRPRKVARRRAGRALPETGAIR